MVFFFYQVWGKPQHWGKAGWGRWCQDRGHPWHRRLRKHRGSPPRLPGAPLSSDSGLEWRTRIDLDCSDSAPWSVAVHRELGLREETSHKACSRLLRYGIELAIHDACISEGNEGMFPPLQLSSLILWHPLDITLCPLETWGVFSPFHSFLCAIKSVSKQKWHSALGEISPIKSAMERVDSADWQKGLNNKYQWEKGNMHRQQLKRNH